MHTQGMTIAQAEDFFVSQGFQGRQIAVEESLRGSQDAMYGYYTLGKLMILKLRADYQKKLGANYTSKVSTTRCSPTAILRFRYCGPSCLGPTTTEKFSREL